MFPIVLFPGDLVEVEKASFILCCTRQAVSHEWIGKALGGLFLFGLILDNGDKSFIETAYDDEWISTNKNQKIMYKVYILGKIVQLDERCFRSKV